MLSKNWQQKADGSAVNWGEVYSPLLTAPPPSLRGPVPSPRFLTETLITTTVATRRVKLQKRRAVAFFFGVSNQPMRSSLRISPEIN